MYKYTFMCIQLSVLRLKEKCEHLKAFHLHIHVKRAACWHNSQRVMAMAQAKPNARYACATYTRPLTATPTHSHASAAVAQNFMSLPRWQRPQHAEATRYQK